MCTAENRGTVAPRRDRARSLFLARGERLSCRRRVGAVNAKSGYAAAVHRDHLQLTARDGHTVAHPRKPPELRESIPAERCPVSLGNLYSMVRADVDQRHRSIELEYTVGFDRRSCGEIVFIRDVADDLLNEVFHRDDACSSAVFVEHHSHMRTGLPKIVEDTLGSAAVRDVKTLACELLE